MRAWPKFEERAEPTADTGLIGQAAALLDVPEVELFALAYRWWFGRPPSGAVLERAFVAYMFDARVPAWARHYAREVLRVDAPGGPAGARLGLDRLHRPAPPRHGPRVVAVTAAAFAVLFLMLLDTSYDARTSAPAPRQERAMSCAGGGPGLQFLERAAYFFSGREWPPC
ncbi:MAG: hypothetical protein ACE5GS_14645 [Kiloniellaceae bacterium]